MREINKLKATASSVPEISSRYLNPFWSFVNFLPLPESIMARIVIHNTDFKFFSQKKIDKSLVFSEYP